MSRGLGDIDIVIIVVILFTAIGHLIIGTVGAGGIKAFDIRIRIFVPADIELRSGPTVRGIILRLLEIDTHRVTSRKRGFRRQRGIVAIATGGTVDAEGKGAVSAAGRAGRDRQSIRVE